MFPLGGLIQGSDGNFYGTTADGGANNQGTVFVVTPGGTLTTLHSFTGSDGGYPVGGLVQTKDGNFYGTTPYGGATNQGTVFKITPSGTLTMLHSFGGADGANPFGALVQATDGNFYGTTVAGGTYNNCLNQQCGTVFRMTPSGILTTLYNFGDPDGGVPDGADPEAGLVQATDGNFYGTAYVGGQFYSGTVFRITPTGTLTTLHNFCAETGCPDGQGPASGLVQGTNGLLYGTTVVGGTGCKPFATSPGCGTVFSLTTPTLIPTTTVLMTAPNPSTPGQNVTMTATVTAQDGSLPTGNVMFARDGYEIGLAALNSSGVAVFNSSELQPGTHTLVATYQGSSTLAPSPSMPVVQVVGGPLASTTAVTSAPNPSTFGQQVTITATVSPAGPPTPTGIMFFTSNGAAVLGCDGVFLNSGIATCMTSTLPTGTNAIVATYSGDFNYTGSSGMLSQIVNPVPLAVQFVPVTPCRIVDTRNPYGNFGGPTIQGNSSRAFPLSESDNPCSIPASAVAYSLNVTVVPTGPLNYLTIWPTGEGQPVVSTLNSLDGRIKANAAIVAAGTLSGAVSVFATDTTNVILDIDGYFVPSGSTLAFYPLTPCRVLDTRNANGPLGGPYLSSGQERDFPVLESSCNIPSSAQAYSMNFTVVPVQGQPLGYLTVWPQGGTRPVVSTLNNLTATIVANGAIVPAGTNGGITTYPSGNTHLVADIDGYFAPAGSGGLSLYTLTPCRVIDTRKGSGQFTGELTVNVVGSPCAPPSNAQAYVFNATVVPSPTLGYLTLWPDTEQQPKVSTLNAIDAAITSNMAIVPNINGKIDAYASGITQLILDLSSYFAP